MNSCFMPANPQATPLPPCQLKQPDNQHQSDGDDRDQRRDVGNGQAAATMIYISAPWPLETRTTTANTKLANDRPNKVYATARNSLESRSAMMMLSVRAKWAVKKLLLR
jgi:hypothetical protein